MTPYELDKWLHRHDFHQANKQGERNTRGVIVLTLTTMGLEIVTGDICILTPNPKAPQFYMDLLHLTVEVNLLE